jgi:hypothetical protein
MEDLALAMTDSLSRSGQGGMLGPFKFVNGVVGAPAASWVSEPTSGLYRNAAQDHRYSISGADVLRIGTNLFQVMGTAPEFRLYETDAAADNRQWSITANGEALTINAELDDGTPTPIVTINRTAGVIDSIDFANVEVSFPGGIDVSGTPIDWTNIALLDGAQTFTATNVFDGSVYIDSGVLWVQDDGPPGIYLQNNDAGADLKGWVLRHGHASNGSFAITTMSDAGSPVSNALNVTRTTVAVTALQFGNATDNPTYSFLGTGAISGVGSGLTALNGTNISSGTVAAARLPAAIAYKDAASNFTAGLQIGGVDVGYINMPQNSQSADYTLVAADAGKSIIHPSGAGAGDTLTIPANSSVAFPLGTVITFINGDSNSVAIAITSDTLTLANTTTTGTRTLAQNGVATAIKVGTTSWIIAGTGLT